MRKFEFILRKILKQRGIRLFIMFFAFMIPSHSWRVFVSLITLSGLLPRDVERGDDETVLILPLRRWELFLYDFLTGFIVLTTAGLFSLSVSSNWSVRMISIGSLAKSVYVLPYIYGLSILCSKYFKSAFVIPLVLVVADMALYWSPWRFVSPVYQLTFVSHTISLLIFTLSFLVYSGFLPSKEG